MPDAMQAPGCSEAGILGPVTGVIGTMQALEALNVLLKTGPGLRGRVMVFDGIAMDWQMINLPRNRDCPACGSRPNYA